MKVIASPLELFEVKSIPIDHNVPEGSPVSLKVTKYFCTEGAAAVKIIALLTEDPLTITAPDAGDREYPETFDTINE